MARDFSAELFGTSKNEEQRNLVGKDFSAELFGTEKSITPTKPLAATTSAPEPSGEEGFFGRNYRYLTDALASGFEGVRSNVKGEVMATTGAIINDIERKYGAGAANAPEDVRSRYETAVKEFAQAKSERDQINQQRVEREKVSPLRPETARLKAAMGSDVGFMESASEAGKAILSNPVGVIADLGVQSLPASMYSAVVALTSYFTTRSLTVGAVSGGTASMISEFGNEYVERREKGESHEEAWKNAQIKTGVIGVLDGVSMGTAGKAAGKVVDALTKQKALGTAVKEAGKETARQAGLGAAGEALGSLAVGEIPNPAQVMAEAVGEAFTGPVEVAGTYRSMASDIDKNRINEAAYNKAFEEYEADFLAKKKAEVEAKTEVDAEEKVDRLKDADPALIDEVKKYIEQAETAPLDTEANITKNLRNYALRLNLDPKKSKTKSRLISYINKAIEEHEGPKPPTPEKLQEVSSYLQGLNTGTATETGGSLFKKLNQLAGRSSGIGVTLEEGKKRNTENLLDALSKATGVDLGSYYQRIGAGAQVPSGPAGVGTAAGVTPPGQPDVGTAGPPTGTPPSGAGVSDSALVDELKNIWGSKDGLPIGLGGYTARDKKLIEGVNRAKQAGILNQVPAEIVEYVDRISQGRARRYQMQEDGTVVETATGPGKTLYLDETGAMSADEEVDAIKDFYNRLAEPFKKVREEGKEGARAGIPTNWNELTLDERQLFLDSLGREQAGVTPLRQRFAEAFDKLAQYKRTKAQYAKQAGIRYDSRMDALASYEIDREAESYARGVEFPAWNDLTKDQQTAYLGQVPMTAGAVAGVRGEESKAGFDAVAKLLPKREEAAATDEAYVRAQQEIEEEELGLKTPLPEDIQDDVKAGRLGSVLSYLSDFARGVSKGVTTPTAGIGEQRGTVSAEQLDQATRELVDAEQELREMQQLYVDQAEDRSRLETALETAKGKDATTLRNQLDDLVSDQEIEDAQQRVDLLNKKISQGQAAVDPITSAINQLVAGVLNKVLSKTKLVYLTDEQIKARGQDPNEFIGEYSPKTDTMFIGRRGLNETTMLHEASHAATVLVLFKYLTGKRNELTPDQMRGAQQIIRIFNQTKGSLQGRFPAAYANVYEFIAYATSVPKFQMALQNMKVKREVVEVKEGDVNVYIDPVIYTNFFQTQEDIKVQEEKTSKKVEGEITVWQKFTQAMAQAIGLTYRFGRLIRNKITPKEYFDSVRKQSAKEVAEGLESAEDQEGYQNFLEDVFAGTQGAPEKVTVDRKLIDRLEKSLARAEAAYTTELQKTKRVEEKLAELPIDQRNKDPEYRAQKDREIDAAEKVKDLQEELYSAGGIEYAPKETKAEQRKRLTVSVEPGYLGNAFLELMGAFNDIAAAPPEEGIAGFKTEALPIKSKPAKKAPVQQPTLKEIESERVKRMEEKVGGAGITAKAIYKIFKESPKEVWLDVVTKFQNTRAYLFDQEKILRNAKKLKPAGPEQNNTATAVTTSLTIGDNIEKRTFKKLGQELMGYLDELSEAYGKNVNWVLARLHTYAIVLHDPERRHVKWLMEAPLNTVQAVTDRERLLKEVLKVPRQGFYDPNADARAKNIWAQLETLVNNTLDKNSPFAKESNSKYDTLGPFSQDYIENVLKKYYDNDPNVKNGTVGKLFDVLRKMDEATRKLNQESNYYSNPVANLVAAYGFKNYFPFKGKTQVGPKDHKYDPFSKKVSGELQEKQNAFDGRITDSDNPIINFLVEASKASRRTGRHRAGVELSIKNNIDNYKKGEIGFKGKFVENITFEQQFDDKVNEELKRSPNNIFVRKTDGSIDIYKIEDDKILNAIKKPYQSPPEGSITEAVNTGFEYLNKVTSLMGQGHTRYNLSFAPIDFIRNTLGYTGIFSAEYGPKTAAKLINAIATSVVMENGFAKTVNYSIAFANGNDAKLKALAAKDPYYKDMDRYYEGGRVAYIQALNYDDTLKDIARSVDKSGLIKTKEQVDKFFDAYLDMFELTTRIAAYRVLRDYLISEGKMSSADAETEAKGIVKNLANFELSGEWGRQLGAFYMFYRPTATGAVRNIEAFAPAFDWKPKDSLPGKAGERYKKMRYIKAMRKQDRYGKLSVDALNKMYEKYDKQRKNARITLTAAAAVGFITYSLAFAGADEDDEGRNKTLTDDTARWVRTARFNTGMKWNGKDLVIQIPWGFGIGAFLSMGAQTAALWHGAQSFGKYIKNVFDAAMESFMPVQVSKVDLSEHPGLMIIDTIAPSVLKPQIQLVANTDTFGRDIYPDDRSKIAAPFTANDSVPEMYKDAAIFMYDTFGIKTSPNVLYFLVNNYIDAVGRVSSTVYNWIGVASEGKRFDIKTDTLFFDGFFKTTSNYDSRQFTSVEKQIKEIERDYNAAATNDRRLIRYTAENPYHKDIIDYYNKFVAGELKKIRSELKDIRTDEQLTQKEREQRIALLNKQQDILKSSFVSLMNNPLWKIKPEEPMIEPSKR
jgi:hypothetical protein